MIATIGGGLGRAEHSRKIILICAPHIMNTERSLEVPKITFTESPIIFSHAVTMPPPLHLATRVTSGARILIAEDDQVSCEILTSRLQNWGYEAVITRDGHEAMTVMRAANAPALAILDWMMPGMDGIEVCRRLREVSKAVYIIFLTSLGTKDNVMEALEAGADDYLVKPFDTFALQTRIRVGLRIIGLQTALANRVKELEIAGAELQDVRGRLQMLI